MLCEKATTKSLLHGACSLDSIPSDFRIFLQRIGNSLCCRFRLSGRAGGLMLGVLLLWHPFVCAVDEDGQAWVGLFTEGRFVPDGHFGWWAEGQTRWRDYGETYQQFILRPALSYWFDDKSSAWLGYAFSRTFPDNGPVDEHRSWIGFMHYFPEVNSLSLILRARLEQRWFDTGNDVGHRFRQMIRLTYPIGGRPDLLWVLRDEIFFNLNSTDYGARSGFEQNRGFGGVAIYFRPKTRLEVGYMNIFGRGRPDTMDHVLATNLYLKF
jgi:hypothetical protein